MNNRDKGERERTHAERSQTGMMRLFGQMLLFPFTVFVFSIELFARTIRELQRTADEGMNLLAGDVDPPSPGISAGEGHSIDLVISGAPGVEEVARNQCKELRVKQLQLPVRIRLVMRPK